MNIVCGTYQNQPFRVSLECGTGLVRCLVRKYWVEARPEELVRQAVVAWLQPVCTEIAAAALVFRVEHNSLDIAIYSVSCHPDFCPDLPPIVIIETKRRDLDPVDTEANEAQLATYLHRHRCPVGVLTNCRMLWGYQREGEQIHKMAVQDFDTLALWIIHAHAQVQHTLAQHQLWFENAQSGCFLSFCELIERYGKGTDTIISFVVERNHIPFLIHATAFRVTGDTLDFRVLRGGVLHERQGCSSTDFRSLEKIRSRSA